MEPLCLFLHGESDQRNTSESEGDDKRVLEHLASECKMRKVSWSFETQNKEENADVIQTSERDVVGDMYVLFELKKAIAQCMFEHSNIVEYQSTR